VHLLVLIVNSCITLHGINNVKVWKIFFPYTQMKNLTV